MKNKILFILLISIVNITLCCNCLAQTEVKQKTFTQKAFIYKEAKQKNMNIDSLDKVYKLSTGDRKSTRLNSSH